MSDDVLSDDISKIVLQPVKDRKKGKKQIARVSRGIVHIHATFNNTKVYISDRAGNMVAWASAGKVGFKGSRKSTGYAAQIVAVEAAKRVEDTMAKIFPLGVIKDETEGNS